MLLARALGAAVVEAVLWVVARIRDAAYEPVEGRFQAFRGNPIDVVEDDDAGLRWLSLRDVRRSLPMLPRERSLAQRFPSRVRTLGEPREPRIEASALEELLARAQDHDTRRFLAWLRRDVVFPAKRKAAMRRGAEIGGPPLPAAVRRAAGTGGAVERAARSKDGGA